MMTWMRLLAIGAVVAQGADVALGEQVPAPGRTDARVRSLRFVEDEVFRLVGAVGYQIELELEPGEQFLGHGGGDLDGISVAAHAHHVLVKPRALGVETNLVIFTDRRTYRFHYSVADVQAQMWPEDLIYAVRFIYPERAGAQSDQLAQQLGSPRTATNWDYWYCGDRSLQPVSMFDDGVRTYVRFAQRGELPTLFVLNEDGSESLLNFNVEAGVLVVHRLARRFVLRRGELVGCVVNKGFVGGGKRLDSGTVTDAVWRDVEIAP